MPTTTNAVRVRLRPSTAADLSFVTALERDAANRAQIGQWRDEQHLSAMAGDDRWRHWIIERGGAPAGYLISRDGERTTGTYVKRVLIAEKERGTGTAAMRAFLDMAFAREEVPYVWLIVRNENVRAQAVYRKLGFVRFDPSPDLASALDAVAEAPAEKCFRMRIRSPREAGMRKVVIETPRLRLREFGIDDAAFIVELLNDPLWRRFIGDRNVRTREEAARYLENGPMRAYAERGFGLWLVETRPDAISIGMCGLVKRDELPDVDLGFAFLEAHRGQGHALEAAGATLRHAHHALGLARIAAITHPANRRSARLLRKLGFVRNAMLEPSATRKDPARLWVHVDGDLST